MVRTRVDTTLISFVASLSYVALMAFVILAALGQMGIQTTSFIAVLGAAGLAVGLALQGSLSNFAAGALLIVFKPFKLGEFIEAGGASGLSKKSRFSPRPSRVLTTRLSSFRIRRLAGVISSITVRSRLALWIFRWYSITRMIL